MTREVPNPQRKRNGSSPCGLIRKMTSSTNKKSPYYGASFLFIV